MPVDYTCVMRTKQGSNHNPYIDTQSKFDEMLRYQSDIAWAVLIDGETGQILRHYIAPK